jgi:hypothetical protein
VKRYHAPALPLARKISLIEPAEHCDRLRGVPRASTHALISPDAARRPAHISRSRSASIRADRPRPSALAAWRNPSRWQEELMNSKPEISVEPILKSLEEEISNSVRGDRLTDRLAGLEPQPDVVGDVNQSIGELIDKVSATSIAELEKLISDLQAVRNYLKAEGDRIQQEMTRYAHLSDTASASVKIVAEKLGQWRKGPTMIKTDSVSLEAKHGNSHDL